MKMLKLGIKSGIAAMTLALCAFNSSAASAQKFVATNNSPTTQLCMAVTTNKPLRVNKTLKFNRITKNIALKKVQCNGEPITDFAYRYGFDRAAKFLHGNRKGSVEIRDIAKADAKPITVTGS